MPEVKHPYTASAKLANKNLSQPWNGGHTASSFCWAGEVQSYPLGNENVSKLLPKTPVDVQLSITLALLASENASSTLWPTGRTFLPKRWTALLPMTLLFGTITTTLHSFSSPRWYSQPPRMIWGHPRPRYQPLTVQEEAVSRPRKSRIVASYELKTCKKPKIKWSLTPLTSSTCPYSVPSPCWGPTSGLVRSSLKTGCVILSRLVAELVYNHHF